MELTRRDAAAALAALGVGSVAATAGRNFVTNGADAPGANGEDVTDSESGGRDERVEETLVAAATVVYPSKVDGVREFVSTFLDGRIEEPEHAEKLQRAVAELDERAVAWYDDPFAALDPSTRDSVLREMGVDTAEPVPDGTTAERIRYYVVNELLLALYTSPTGGTLVGIENPQGHPGGTETYQRGPGP
jgi:hypothetical protein